MLKPSLAIVLLLPLFSTAVSAQESEGGLLESLSIEQLPVAGDSGSVTIPDGPTIEWQPNDSAEHYLRVGNILDLGTEQLTLNQLGEATGFNGESVALSDLETLKFQSIQSLTTAIPNLKQYSVQDIGPIRDALSGNNLDKTVGEILSSQGHLPLANLSQYSIQDIPGLGNTPLGQLKNFEATRISGVPGLQSLAFSQYPNPIGAAVWGKVDVVYGHYSGSKETNRNHTITGGLHASGGQPRWNIPCQTNCSYVELETDSVNVHGYQFISEQQKVEGGWGVLKWVNGGKEPTGRHPWGKSFKVTIADLEEDKGTGLLLFQFRYCQRDQYGRKIGCSPYFLPMPLQRFNEKDKLPLGIEGLGQITVNNDSTFSRGGDLSLNPSRLQQAFTDTPNPLASPLSLARGQGGPASSPNAQDLPLNTPIAEGNETPEANENTCPQPGRPTQNRFPITSQYGPRRQPCSTCSKFHRGTDLGTPYQTRILAMQDGLVIASQVHQFNGLYIAIEGCDEHQTFYLHLDQARVKEGDWVKKGDVIGLSGGGPPSPKAHRGSSTGNHLHVGVRNASSYINPQNYRRL